MKKEFIPYEQALALKELGFDEPCLARYNVPQELILSECYSDSSITHLLVTQNDVCEAHVLAPTFSQAFRWFREKYELNFYIWKKEDLFRIVLQRPFENSYFFNDEFKTYEEAELECLKKLIEIVKNK